MPAFWSRIVVSVALLPVVLGIVWLGERLAPNQYVGIVVLVIGLVALGLLS